MPYVTPYSGMYDNLKVVHDSERTMGNFSSLLATFRDVPLLDKEC